MQTIILVNGFKVPTNFIGFVFCTYCFFFNTNDILSIDNILNCSFYEQCKNKTNAFNFIVCNLSALLQICLGCR